MHFFVFFLSVAVAMCIRFLYVSSFLFLYGAFLLSAIRLFMKTDVRW